LIAVRFNVTVQNVMVMELFYFTQLSCYSIRFAGRGRKKALEGEQDQSTRPRKRKVRRQSLGVETRGKGHIH
jgi:hypothetical protein